MGFIVAWVLRYLNTASSANSSVPRKRVGNATKEAEAKYKFYLAFENFVYTLVKNVNIWSLRLAGMGVV